MKTTKAVLPIIFLVTLLTCAVGTFAWFNSEGGGDIGEGVIEVGTYFRVYLGKQGQTDLEDPIVDGALQNDEYNGQKGYDDVGAALEGPDAPYTAEYHGTLKIMGGADCRVAFGVSEAHVRVGGFFTWDNKTCIDSVLSYFDAAYVPPTDYSSYIGTQNGGLYTPPADNDMAQIYFVTEDGTPNTSIDAIVIRGAAVKVFFDFSCRKVSDDGTHEPEKGTTSLSFVYGYKGEVWKNPKEAKVNTLCYNLGYYGRGADGITPRAFAFSDEVYRSSTFGFVLSGDAYV